jgi:hypothetical protein
MSDVNAYINGKKIKAEIIDDSPSPTPKKKDIFRGGKIFRNGKPNFKQVMSIIPDDIKEEEGNASNLTKFLVGIGLGAGALVLLSSTFKKKRRKRKYKRRSY